MIEGTDIYKNTGAIHTDPENDVFLLRLNRPVLEQLESMRHIKVEDGN